MISYWRKIIRPFQIICATIDGQREDWTFLGLIDQPTEGNTIGSGQGSKTFSFSAGLLLPKLLSAQKIVTSQMLVDMNNAKIKQAFGDNLSFFKWVRGYVDRIDKNVFQGNKPEDAIRWILNNCLHIKYIPTFDIHGGVEVQRIDTSEFLGWKNDKVKNDVLDFKILEEDLLYDPTLTTYTGTILEYIKSCLDMGFYELFFDTITRNGQPYNCMKIRTIPYSSRKVNSKSPFSSTANWAYWDDLPVYTIDDSKRLSDNLAISDREIGNYFQMHFDNNIMGAPGGVMDTFGYGFPLVNTDSAQMYGLREIGGRTKMILNMAPEIINKGPYTSQSGLLQDIYNNVLPILNSAQKQYEISLNEYLFVRREKLAEWFSFPNYECGQLSIVGDEDATIGMKLDYTDREYFEALFFGEMVDASGAIRKENFKEISGRGMEYYIKGVTHSYTYPGFFQTNLQLTRGVPKGGQIADWYAAVRPHFTAANLNYEGEKVLPANSAIIIPCDILRPVEIGDSVTVNKGAK
jgi:hypothetical protein